MEGDSVDFRYGRLFSVADYLVKKSVWGIGGDGWAYDIGFGGLDHVLASNRNINHLVLNTQVYSNTGGQCSKATPMGAVALFAAGGKLTAKKDLAAMLCQRQHLRGSGGHGYTTPQTLRAFIEAESYDGPSLIIAYSHCINQGIDMTKRYDQQKAAVETGSWFLWRFDPRLAAVGKNPWQIDMKEPSRPVTDFAYNENRFNMLKKSHPETSELIMARAQNHVWTRWGILKQGANIAYDLESPFETGVLDAETRAETGGVTGTNIGMNMPAAGEPMRKKPS